MGHKEGIQILDVKYCSSLLIWLTTNILCSLPVLILSSEISDLPMVLIFCSSQHVAYALGKIGLFGEKKSDLWLI